MHKTPTDFGGADYKVLLSAIRKLSDFALINEDDLEPLHAKGLVLLMCELMEPAPC